MKTVFKVILLLGLAVYFIFAITTISRSRATMTCAGLNVVIIDERNTGFVSEDEVRELLVNNGLHLEGQLLKDINLAELEKILVASPYIETALCYVTSDSRLTIQITPRIPVLHVINEHGDDFYIDNCKGVMPRAYHHIDLILMTGHVDSLTAGSLYSQLGVRLSGDEFWDNQIEQIYVTETGEMEITPRVGDHTILLGDTSNLEDKLERLRVFYDKGLSQAGWNKYKTINLKYDNQIVCTKR